MKLFSDKWEDRLVPMPTFEGYCLAVEKYAATGDVFLRKWMAAVDDALATGQLRWDPPKTDKDKEDRKQALYEAATTIGLLNR